LCKYDEVQNTLAAEDGKVRMESYRVIRCERGLCRNDDHELIQEEPLLIRVDDKPYSVVMRTPGDEIPTLQGSALGRAL